MGLEGESPPSGRGPGKEDTGDVGLVFEVHGRAGVGRGNSEVKPPIQFDSSVYVSVEPNAGSWINQH